jgi:hypothetical protein
MVFEQNGKFSTKYMYMLLEKNLVGDHYKWIWLAKITIKSVGTIPRCIVNKGKLEKKEVAWISYLFLL